MMRLIRDCKVVVVGGAGFLGSHMVNHLINDRGCKVMVVDNLSSGRREFIHRSAEFEHADITLSEGYLHKVFKAFGAEYVFNYAAHPYIPVSFDRPIHVFMANAVGAMFVINAAHDAGCKGILQVSSAELYGEGRLVADLDRNVMTKNDGFLSEDEPVSPHSTYGCAKAAIDFYVQSRWKEARTPCIALRQFNCVGERETHPYVIPEIISQLHLNGGNLRLGNNSTRDFLYAGDQAKMAAELLESGSFGEVYNLGSEQGITIYDLAQLVADRMGCGRVRVEQDPAKVRPWEIWHLRSDNTKIHSVISHRPVVNLKEAITRTLVYFHGNGSRWCWEK